jgi:spore germination protein GerM
MKNMRIFQIVAGVLLVALVATACNEDGRDAVPQSGAGSPTPSVDATEEPTVEPVDSNEPQAVRVWLEREGGGLFPVSRETDAFPALGRAAMTELLEGPTDAEVEAGVGSAIPKGTSLRGLTIQDGLATVDLSEDFEAGAGSLAIRLRVAQVVFTLTEFPSVDGVLFELEGEPVEVFSSEGLVLEDPQGRRAYRDLLPPIVVYEPDIGDSSESPLSVSGTATVFEATVSMRLLVDGAEVAQAFTTATCGTGCRGRYEHKLRFEVDRPTEAVLEVFESSAEDGSPLHVVRIPVELLPS